MAATRLMLECVDKGQLGGIFAIVEQREREIFRLNSQPTEAAADEDEADLREIAKMEEEIELQLKAAQHKILVGLQQVRNAKHALVSYHTSQVYGDMVRPRDRKDKNNG